MRKADIKADDLLNESNIHDVAIPNTTIVMRGLKTRHEEAPEKGPYRFAEANVCDVAVGIKLGLNTLFTGPTGCGKTSLPIALAAELGRPLVRFNLNGETRVSHIVGQQRPVARDGVLGLAFSLGPFARAMREGWWVILDEIEAAPPTVLFVLQPVLEEGRRELHIPDTNSVIEAHPEFRIFATGNTLGYRASARAQYAGTNVVNSALLDRFGLVVDVGYPPRLEEIERLRVHCPEVDSDYLDGICRVAEKLRGDTSFRSDFSTRRCIQWARLLPHYANDVIRTSELAFVRKLENAADAKVAREVIRRVFGYEGKAT